MQSETTYCSIDDGESELREKINEARLYLEQGLYDEARRIFQELLSSLQSEQESPSTDPARRISLEGRLAYLQQQLEAIDHLEAQLPEQPLQAGQEDLPTQVAESTDTSQSEGAAFFNRGEAFLDIGLFAEAIKEFERAAELNYHSIECAVQIGRAHLELGQYHEGLQVLQDFSRDKDLSASERNRLLVQMATIYESADDKSKALELYSQVAKVDQHHLPAARKIKSLTEEMHRYQPDEAAVFDAEQGAIHAEGEVSPHARLVSRGDALFSLRLADKPEYEIQERILQDEIHDIFRVRRLHDDLSCIARTPHPEIVGQAVAEDFILRLAYEQTTMANSNICRVLDIAESRRRYYLITEDYQLTLEELLRQQGQLTLAEVLRLARAMLNALAYAHSHRGTDDTFRKIFHLALNPTRVLLRGDVATARIIDFGLSFQLDSRLDFAPNYQDRSPYELAYMAPEQFERSPAKMTDKMKQATDLYTFGLILYRTITGKLPFEGPSPEDFKVQHAEKYPIPPRVYVSRIPLKLDEAILRCLHKDPKKRWRTPTELDLALDRIHLPS